ncbi:hypothetical protein [Moorena bouillonii]|uniref:hypothetical protein n=1 Tax=Moorena bouillonii TaxID=207920 RepID=UPI0013010780|nr:hypothetical protein [Moorena bouillonii]
MPTNPMASLVNLADPLPTVDQPIVGWAVPSNPMASLVNLPDPLPTVDLRS